MKTSLCDSNEAFDYIIFLMLTIASNSYAIFQIEIEDVITMDGIERAVVVANNSIPGPPIIVYENQQVCLFLVYNLKLLSKVTFRRSNL